MSELPVVIEAAINGMGTKDRNPHIPVTASEVTACAVNFQGHFGFNVP